MSCFDKYTQAQENAEKFAEKGGFPAERIRVLAVTKNQSADVIGELYGCGVREFAENRLNVLEEKVKILPEDIVWHFIGKIQSNKVRKILKLAKVLHSVDSPELLERIERISGEEGIFPEVFIEVNISGEESKSGISAFQLSEMLSQQLKNVRVAGLMTMAPADCGEDELRSIFSALKKLADDSGLPELSMGMSNDYHIAAECGATIVRLGTALFV